MSIIANTIAERIAFEIFGVSVAWYGIIIVTGVIVALLVGVLLCKKRGLSTDTPFELLVWCFPLAIIGARAYFCIFSGETYSFMEFIAIWNGGMAIYGGLIGGIIGIILYCVIRKKNFLQTLDLIAPCLIIAQSIGRWGNFVNQEVYGLQITDPSFQWFPFGVYIEALGEWHYATFFYESMLTLAGFFLLYFLFRKHLQKGVVLSAYLIYYGTVRFFLELLRAPSEILFIGDSGIPVSCVVSAVMVLVGVGYIVYLAINNKKTGQKFQVEKTQPRKG